MGNRHVCLEDGRERGAAELDFVRTGLEEGMLTQGNR